MEGKYIIVKVLGHKVPILFGSLIEHKEFAFLYPGQYILSAGFFGLSSDQDNHDYHHINVWGQSTSLNIEARPEDKEIIEKFLNT